MDDIGINTGHDGTCEKLHCFNKAKYLVRLDYPKSIIQTSLCKECAKQSLSDIEYTYVFQDVEKKFTFSVLKDFLIECRIPEQFTAFELNVKFEMWKYLHSTTGPAIIRHRDNRVSFWINGCLVEDVKKAKDMEDNWSSISQYQITRIKPLL